MKKMFFACGRLRGDARLLPPPLQSILATLYCREERTERGLALFAAGDVPVRVLAHGRGWVIGHLFDEAGLPAPDALEPAIFDLENEAIIDRFWGGYVALVADGEVVRILRDPSGGLACYHARVGDNFYVTSAPHLLIDTGMIKSDLDWEVIGRSLSQHAARDSRTALRGINEVLPGEAITIGADTSLSRSVWDPWRSAKQPLYENAASRLEQVLMSTLAAWGRCTRRPLIEISGGLDSAIVAAGISPATGKSSLITFAAAPGDADETAYARAIAKHLGLNLQIACPRIEDVDLSHSLSRNLPRPNARAFVQAADLQSLRYAEKISADAFFSGGGGDDVFCYLRTILPAIDRLHIEGFRASLESAGDIARMNHATVWDALFRIARRAIRGRSRKRPSDISFLDRRIQSTNVGAGIRKIEDDRQPGKAAHVEGILSIHNYLEGHARADFAPIYSPLLSQPIMECCLSIPTWLWCKGGQNRAVARDAFADRLPRPILERRSKGSFDGFCAHLLHANRKLIGGMLMDGILAEHELISRDEVMLALQDPFPPAETIGRILALVDAESWAASWRARLLQRD